MKKASWVNTVCVTIATIVVSSVAWADSKGSYYPDAAQVDIMNQEQIEQRKADDLEREATQQREYLEKRKREIERRVNASRHNIEELKRHQAESTDELETLKVEINNVNDRLKGLDEQREKQAVSGEKTQAMLRDLKKDLDNKRKVLEEKLSLTTKERQDYEKSIYDKSMDIQKMRTDLERLETRRLEAETLRANLDAEEMHVRTEWMQTKLIIAEKMRRRDQAVSEMNEAKERHNKAMADYNAAKAELAKAEKVHYEVDSKVKAEVARYEDEIVKANRARIGAESEKIRVEAEVAKLKDYESKIRDVRDDAVDQKLTAEGFVLRSKVAVQTARTELSGTLESQDQRVLKGKKQEAQARGLAAADEASRLFEGGRAWMATGTCDSYDRPGKSGRPQSSISRGNKFLARESGNQWIELIDGSGSTFIEASCGRFEK